MCYQNESIRHMVSKAVTIYHYVMILQYNVVQYTYFNVSIQWNLFIMDTLGPAISASFLLLYRGFPLSEVKMY